MFRTAAWYCIWILLTSAWVRTCSAADVSATCAGMHCTNPGVWQGPGVVDDDGDAPSLSLLQTRASSFDAEAAASYAYEQSLLQVNESLNYSANVSLKASLQNLDWVQISSTYSCEDSDASVHAITSRPGHSLVTCKDWCLEMSNCSSIDFYETSSWCLLYEKSCTHPTTQKDGSSSYRLVVSLHDDSHDERPQAEPIAQIELAPFPTKGSSLQDVFKWMTDYGSPWAAQQMKDDEIDGDAFLLLRTQDLKEYGLKKGPALKLSRRIQEAAGMAHIGKMHHGATPAALNEEETNALHEVVGPDGVLMISLDNKPERFAYASQQLRKAGITATKFSATDKDTATREELGRGCPHQFEPGVKELCEAASRTGHGCATNIEQAIASSHLRALQTARRRQWEWTAIFEDDAIPAMTAEWSSIFRRAWKELPPHTRIVRLGWCQIDAKSYPAPIHQQIHTNVTGALVTQYIGWGQPFQYEPGGCTTAYLVHQQVLADLLALFPCCGPVDSCFKWDFYKKINKKTGIEHGLEMMMNIDSHMDPVFDDAVEHHGLILQDRKMLWSQRA